MAKRKDLLERLGDKFVVGDECWPWVSPSLREGYGVVRVGFGRGAPLRSAFVVLYELLVGPVPEGMELDHLCQNRLCVRPAHMEPVTRRENLRRASEAMGPEGRSERVRRSWITRKGG